MAQSYFIWNGVDCRSMGVKLKGPVSIVRPEERVKHIEIPGRSGDLTQLEGDNIFNSYIQTAGIMVQGGYRVRDIYKWLRGSGFVTFSGEPDRRQAARIIGAITLDKHSHNMDWWEGEIQFYCQPLKQKLIQAQDTVSLNGTIINTGDVDEKPCFVVTCTGGTATLTVGDKSISVTDNTQGTLLRIDSDAMMVTDPSMALNWNKWAIGDYPVLKPGSNTIGGSGWSSVTIWRRERFL